MCRTTNRFVMAVACLAVAVAGCRPAPPEVIAPNKQAIVINEAGNEETIDAALLGDDSTTIAKVSVVDRRTKKKKWVTLETWREDKTHTRYLLVQP